MQPPAIRKLHPSSIKLERIQPRFTGEALDAVLVIFIARHPQLGGQRIVGWYRNATVHRNSQHSNATRRKYLAYYVETTVAEAVLVPHTLRSFVIPKGKGGFGQANVCYLLDSHGQSKKQANWMLGAIEYVEGYQQEDAANQPKAPHASDL